MHRMGRHIAKAAGLAVMPRKGKRVEAKRRKNGKRRKQSGSMRLKKPMKEICG